MKEKKQKKITGGDFLALALYAFLGLGMEIVLLFAEEAVYGVASGSFAAWQRVLHWSITCVVWLGFAFFLAHLAKKKYGFDLLEKPAAPVPAQNWVLAVVLVAVCVALNAWDWGTLKILGEFARKAGVLFVFQYLYYLCEVVLVVLVVAFGQRAGEMWSGQPRMPWGGIVAGLTWGLVHALTKGDIFVGLQAMFAGLLYGCIYLLVKKRAAFAYPLMLLAFAL